MKEKPYSKLKNNNIAFVGNTSFSLYKFRLGVMRSFVALGYNVFAIAPEDEYSDFFSQEKINFISIKVDGKGTNVLTDIKLIYNFIQIYKYNEIDFIFHYTIKPNIYGSIACRILDIPTIAITTGLGFSFNKKNILNWLVKKLYKFSLSKTLEVWFLNAHDKQSFINNKIVKFSKAFILPSEGIDSVFYSPMPKTEENGKFKFLLLSRLIENKGIREYAKAAEILRNKGLDVECQLLGKQDKDASKSIPVQLVHEWHDKSIINYLGERIDVRKYIAECDCVVLPSYYMEGIPRCLMEAMSMEKPIITTDNVGCKELIVDNVNGYKCIPRDIENLAKKMEKMFLTDVETRNLMGRNGRIRVINDYEENIIIGHYHTKFNSFYKILNAKHLHCVVPDSEGRYIPINKDSATVKSNF